jgi:hypothetical protein
MGHDTSWDDVTNLERRARDGVVAVTQANYDVQRAAEQEQVRSSLCLVPDLRSFMLPI